MRTRPHHLAFGVDFRRRLQTDGVCDPLRGQMARLDVGGDSGNTLFGFGRRSVSEGPTDGLFKSAERSLGGFYPGWSV